MNIKNEKSYYKVFYKKKVVYLNGIVDFAL